MPDSSPKLFLNVFAWYVHKLHSVVPETLSYCNISCIYLIETRYEPFKIESHFCLLNLTKIQLILDKSNFIFYAKFALTQFIVLVKSLNTPSLSLECQSVSKCLTGALNLLYDLQKHTQASVISLPDHLK